MSQQNLDVCPLFEFRPLDGHDRTMVTYEIIFKYSDSCIEFAAYLSRETAPYPFFACQLPGHMQDGIREVLQSYAHLFVRTIAIIPADFVPPESHISNINRQIEGRPIGIDLGKCEVVFRIDDTSIRKLEVFYTELTGKEPDSWFTEKLSQLRVRMAMSKVVGYNILGFKEVFGDLFDTVTLNNPVCSGWIRGCRSPFPNLRDVGRDKWTSFHTPPPQHEEDQFPSTQFEPYYSDKIFPTVIASKALNDVLNLETFPQDRSTSPQMYWGRPHVRQPLPQQATASNGKPYGSLGHNRRAYHFQSQPSISFPAPLQKNGNFQQQTPNSPPAWVTGFLNGIQGGDQGLTHQRSSRQSSRTPLLSRRSTSSDMRSEISTPSDPSTTFQPFVRSTSVSSPPSSDCALTDVSWEEREYTDEKVTTNKRRLARSDEYNFIFVADNGRMPSANRMERESDPTRAIIQGKMEAMLGAAESEGYICKATLDGVDNHPISVRLKTISGRHESLKNILGSRECSTTTNYENSLNADRESNLPSINTTNASGRLQQYSDTGNSSSRGNHTINSVSNISTTSSITGVSLSRDYDELDDKNFSEYRMGLDLDRSTEDLKALKLKLELEGKKIVELHCRILKRIQKVEAAILKSESGNPEVMKQARKMVEYCGYDESAFIHESTTSGPFNSNHAYEGAATVANKIEDSFVKQETGRSNAFEENFRVSLPGAISENVSTRYYENHTEPNEASPAASKHGNLEGEPMFYAHSSVPIVMPIPARSSAAANPIDLWELNYAVGAQREMEVQHYKERFFDSTPMFSVGRMPGLMQSFPPQRSYFGNEGLDPSQHFLPVAPQQYAATHHFPNYDSLTLQQPTHQIEPTPNNYFQKLAEYLSNNTWRQN